MSLADRVAEAHERQQARFRVGSVPPPVLLADVMRDPAPNPQDRSLSPTAGAADDAVVEALEGGRVMMAVELSRRTGMPMVEVALAVGRLRNWGVVVQCGVSPVIREPLYRLA